MFLEQVFGDAERDLSGAFTANREAEEVQGVVGGIA